MKTFKQHVNEHSYMGGQVGADSSNSIEDGSIGAHNIQDAAVLQKVNAFVGSVADMEYIKPQQAVDSLREKLMRIGLDISPMKLEGDAGTVSLTRNI